MTGNERSMGPLPCYHMHEMGECHLFDDIFLILFNPVSADENLCGEQQQGKSTNKANWYLVYFEQSNGGVK